MAERVRIIVQARMTSTRLPGKSLLPVDGRPLARLVLERAASTGREVVLATSAEVSDDPLAAVAHDSGFAVRRGSRDDVLGRFLAASADLDDADLIVRLTADNPVPDGALVDDLVTYLQAHGLDYAYIDQTAVPHGLSAEVFTAGALRKLADSVDPRDREHVTTAIRRGIAGTAAGDLAAYRPELPPGAGPELRCTVDLPDDLNAMITLMQGRSAFGWRELVEALT